MGTMKRLVLPAGRNVLSELGGVTARPVGQLYVCIASLGLCPKCYIEDKAKIKTCE